MSLSFDDNKNWKINIDLLCTKYACHIFVFHYVYLCINLIIINRLVLEITFVSKRLETNFSVLVLELLNLGIGLEPQSFVLDLGAPYNIEMLQLATKLTLYIKISHTYSTYTYNIAVGKII